MNRKMLASLMLLTIVPLSLVSRLAVAQTVELAALGSFELLFEPVQRVATYPAQPVAATVTFREGEAFAVPSPGRVQQIEYLVEPGASVVQGQAFAVLRGPEMHHFEMGYQSSQALLAIAQKRFNSNKVLYERKAVSASQWQEISEKYYTLLLEHEHMRHFFELVIAGDDDPDALTLAAPLAGVIDYSSAYGGVEEGDSIALFIPNDAIRLEAALPNGMRDQVVALRAADCELVVDRISGMTDGFFVQVWSGSLTTSCSLILGQRVLATPLLKGTDVYSVRRSAVFQLERQTQVLAREGSSLVAVAVSLLGAEDDNYVLRADVDLKGREVLVSSVSAVQGILMGLGGD